MSKYATGRSGTPNRGRGRGRGATHRPKTPRGRSRHRGLYVGLAVAVLAGLVGLGFLFFWPETGEEQGAVCSIVVDRTGSSLDDEVAASYLAFTKSAIEGCRERRAATSIAYFSNDGNKLIPLNGGEAFPLWQPKSKRANVGEGELAETVREAEEAAASIFETPTSTRGHGSDILTALRLAAEELQSQSGESFDERYLVVISDGYQTGAEVGVRQVFTEPSVPADELLGRAVSVGLIPNLANVDVSFVGAGGGNVAGRSRIPAWQETRIREFWNLLVGEGGGRMCSFNISTSNLPTSC